MMTKRREAFQNGVRSCELSDNGVEAIIGERQESRFFFLGGQKSVTAEFQIPEKNKNPLFTRKKFRLPDFFLFYKVPISTAKSTITRNETICLVLPGIRPGANG